MGACFRALRLSPESPGYPLVRAPTLTLTLTLTLTPETTLPPCG